MPQGKYHVILPLLKFDMAFRVFA